MKKNSMLSTAGLMFGLVLALQGVCAGTATVPQPAVAAQTSAKQLESTEQPVKTAIPETPPLAGKVVETMNSGGYTYIYLEKDSKKGWIAVPASDVKVGQEIKVKPGMEMGLFSSRTLNRSFDNIIFSPGIVTEAKSQPIQDLSVAKETSKLPAGHQAADKKTNPMGQDEMHMAASGNAAESLIGTVVDTMDAGGYTYINLDKDGTQTWVAVPTMKVTLGEQMELQSGAVMTNFTSKSLNRTFDRVVFSGGPLQGK